MPMRIHEIEITDVRGIRHVVLSPQGDNLVIWGPNGSGKSAVVDSIEFLLQGRISRLEGTGTGSVSLKRHGPHIDRVEAGTSKVRAVLSLKGKDDTFEVIRAIGSSELMLSDESKRPDLESVLDVASSNQYVLARREILEFITAPPLDRASGVQELLRLNHLEVVRKTLVSAAGTAARRQTAAGSGLTAARRVMASAAGLEAWDHGDLMDAVNAAREVLKADAIETLDPSAITGGIPPPSITKQDAAAVNVRDLAAGLSADWPGLVRGISEHAEGLLAAAQALCKDAEALGQLHKHDLIELGLEQIPEDGSCPLCGTSWNEGALSAKLGEELSTLKGLADRRDETVRLLGTTRTATATAWRRLEGLLKPLKELGRDEHEVVKTLVEVLRGYAESLGALAERIDPDGLSSLEVPSTLTDKDWAAVWASLEQAARKMTPEPTSEQKAWELLRRLAERASDLQRTTRDADRAQLLASRAATVRDAYVAAKNKVLTDLYNSVRDRFVELYVCLHGADGESAFRAELEQEDAGIRFEVDFFERGLFPPQALHSEGHQDSMGICLYLALAEYINKGVIGVTILDDVVMSVDIGHRKRLCRVLKEHFDGTQFIITTHERVWAQQLRGEGVVKSKNLVQFCGWSIDAGPRLNDTDVWGRIGDCLENDDVRGAAAYLRGAMEELCAEVCENLSAKVEYRSTAQYTLGDLLPAAWSRYNKLLRQAKEAAQSHGETAQFKKLKEIHSIAAQCYAATTAEQWVVNKGIHFDTWHTLGKQDFSDVVSSMRDMSEQFTCSRCGGRLHLATRNHAPVTIRCGCPEIAWNLEKKRS